MTRLRFPRGARLTRGAEFARVRAEGRTEHGKLMVCSVVRRDEAAEPARIGFITSRRVGPAVDRNRVRRRLREIVRADRARLPRGAWVVVIARPSAVRATFNALREEWRRLAKRAGLIVLEP